MNDIPNNDLGDAAAQVRLTQITSLVQAAGVGLWDWDLLTNAVYFSPEWKLQLGYTDQELPNRFEAWEQRLHADDLAFTRSVVKDFLEGRRTTYDVEFRLRHKNGSWRWIFARADCVRNAAGQPVRMMGCHLDVTERKQTEALLSLQRDTLERIASGVPLKVVLTTLARSLETHAEGILCSILLLDEDGIHLTHGAAPSLPDDYCQAIDGMSIGPAAGSCGTAVYRRAPVVVEDIANDPLWAAFKALALPHGLRACWSTPILDTQGAVIGTFAIYYRQPARPSAQHLELVRIATQMCSIAIQKQRSEAAQRMSELALNAISQGVIITDAGQRIVSANDAYALITGYPTMEIVGKTCRFMQGPLTDSRTVEAMRLALTHVGEFAGEILNYRKDGTPFWADLSITSVCDEQGCVTRFIGVIRDVTERKQGEEALKAGEARFRATFEQAAVGIVHTAIDGRYLQVNQKFCDMLGYSESELLGQPATDFSHPEDRELGFQFRQRIWEGELDTVAGEKRYIRKDGSVIWTNRTVSLARDDSGKPLYFIRVIEDITARKAVEEQYRATFDNAPVGIMHTAIDGYRILRANHKLCEMLGYTEDELLRMTSTEIVHPDYQFSDRSHYMSQMLSNRLQSFASERKLVGKDGRSLWVNRTVSLVRNAAGVPLYFIRIIEDITQRKAVAQASARLAAIVDFSNDAILSRGLDRKILTWNAAAERLLGYSAAEAIGQPSSLVIPPDRESEATGKRALLDTGQPIPPYDTVRVAKDGRRIDVSATQSPIKDASGEMIGVSVTFRDISERKQAETARVLLEAQLREAQKMEAIGTLAGGVAHDFNNIIATILGNAELARQDAESNFKVVESVEEIRKAGTRARSLVQQILSFSRRQLTERKRVALAPIVEESARLLRAVLPARVALKVCCDGGVPDVLADANQIEQVLINLATNALQAMQHGSGTVEINLDTVLLDAAWVERYPVLGSIYAKHPDRTVRLKVSDDGPGMDAATLDRIFEPFFTTKPVGSGTGLGLSVVHGIVTGHEGAIVARSEPGRGATFTIYLPAAPAQIGVPASDSHIADPAKAGRGQRILYLDDEESMVYLVKRYLEKCGYRVSGHASQREAIDALRADPSGFDLLVTDYNMPGLSGLDVAREARLICPDLPLAIISGFIDDELRTQAAKIGVQSLIDKADAIEEIGEVVQRLARGLS
ncbi:MAG: PAS domain S-box protein [Burkholderiales bacterium]